MEITLKEQLEIKTIIQNYFENGDEIESVKEIKVYQSDCFVNISIYPKSSLSLSLYDLKILIKRLEENNSNYKHIADLTVINFDTSEKCLTLSLDFSE